MGGVSHRFQSTDLAEIIYYADKFTGEFQHQCLL
jgi:hypothetical protein